MARPHDFEVTNQGTVQPWVVLASANGPRIEIRRQLGLRPIVTVDDRPVSAKWNRRAGGIFAYLAAIVAFGALAGGSSLDNFLPYVPLAVAFFLVELPWLGTYEIPMRDGTKGAMRLKRSRRGLRAMLNGAEIPLEPDLSTPMVVLSYLPTFVLFAAILIRFAPFGGPNVLGTIGPVVTGALGFAAFAGGQAVARSLMRQGTRLILALGLCLVVGGLELAMHYGKPDFPVGRVGTCLDLGPGSSLRTTTPPVDCNVSHRSEVVGVVVLDDGPYPGSFELANTASDRCGELFAAYVGSVPDASQLKLSFFGPSSDLWGLGARSVTCVAYRIDGLQLTQSVQGSGL
jgi:hypothetical protein